MLDYRPASRSRRPLLTTGLAIALCLTQALPAQASALVRPDLEDKKMFLSLGIFDVALDAVVTPGVTAGGALVLFPFWSMLTARTGMVLGEGPAGLTYGVALAAGNSNVVGSIGAGTWFVQPSVTVAFPLLSWLTLRANLGPAAWFKPEGLTWMAPPTLYPSSSPMLEGPHATLYSMVELAAQPLDGLEVTVGGNSMIGIRMGF